VPLEHQWPSWNYLWPGDQAEEDHQALIRQARHDPPALVLINNREIELADGYFRVVQELQMKC
jgi:hypothetical protein